MLRRTAGPSGLQPVPVGVLNPSRTDTTDTIVGEHILRCSFFTTLSDPWENRSIGIVAIVGMLLLGCGDDSTSISGTDGESGSTDEDSLSPTAPGTDSSTTSTQETSPLDSSSSDEGSSSSGDPLPDPVEMEGPSVAVTPWTSCQVREDGALWCWGDGSCGMFGDGTNWGRIPKDVDGDANWSSVDLGWRHACGVQNDGSLWCWGDGSDGRLGDGTFDDILSPQRCRVARVEVGAGEPWAQVSAGEEHSCAVRQDGTLWCWGHNTTGQIGDGAVGGAFTRIEPVQVGLSDDWRGVFAGDEHTCGRRADDTLWCWGDGNALGDGGGSAFASSPVMVAGPSTWTALPRGSAGAHTCAIASDQTVWCWGEGDQGQLGNGQDLASDEPIQVDLGADAVSVSVALGRSCAVLDDQTLWCWGSNSNQVLGLPASTPSSSTPIQIHEDQAWADVRVSLQHTCATDVDGAAWCWGSNWAGQVGDHTSGADNSPRLQAAPVGVPALAEPSNDWVSIVSGGAHGCGVRDDGTAWCWGSRYRGQLGNDDPVDDCSASNPTACIFTSPQQVDGDGPWGVMAAGSRHTCAFDDSEVLWCWGDNSDGQLGTGGLDGASPSMVSGGADWDSFTAGSTHTCGVQADGTLWCWGSGWSGELGNGASGAGASLDIPGQVGADADWTQVTAGGRFTCGIRDGGELWCWGNNSWGQIGNGETATEQLELQQVPGTWDHAVAGGTHTCAVDSAGFLRCWGANERGQCGQDPSNETVLTPMAVNDETDWDQLVLGDEVTCATKTDGTLWCWGTRESGELGDGTIDREGSSDVPQRVGAESDWISISGSAGHVCGVRSDGGAWCWGDNLAGQQGNDTAFISGTPRQVVQ